MGSGKKFGCSFTLNWVSGKLGLTNESRAIEARFRLKTVSRAISRLYLHKSTCWEILMHFGVLLFGLLVCKAFDTTLG